MEKVYFEGQVLWSQIDANRHVRHSAYADFCAQARSNMMNSIGLSLDKFAESHIGPILFREELIFHREILLDDHIKVEVEWTKYNKSNSRFSFRHKIFRSDGTLCATVNVDGAWMNLNLRKLTTIPTDWEESLQKIPKSEDFEITEN